MTDPVADVRAWLRATWDPEIPLAKWWLALADAGWAVPAWPGEWYGRGLDVADAARVQRAIVEHGALGPPGGLGLLLAGPTILLHGDDAQRARYLPDIVTGRAGWCQLFSEPVAGSDLAGLQTKAVRDGDEWIVSGQKVWTSSAHLSDYGMLLARTNPEAPKHKGLTWFALDMRQPGIDVRPLRELTGRSLFNEVFLTDVRVASDAIIGGLDNGWAVANATLGFERSGLGAGSAGGGETFAVPGSLAGDLELPAGAFVHGRPGGTHAPEAVLVDPQVIIDAARRHGRPADPLVRQALARLHTEEAIGRYMSARDVPGAPNIAKLRMSEMFRSARDVGLAILAGRGMVHDYAPDAVVDRDRDVLDVALWSPGPSIYGGTDQIQRNILAERVLGLPREASDDRTVPFSRLRRNA